ncbi:MAG: cytochrome c [Gammaproteobacteria bacterium]|nr:cytochrome c [Gammaproteobacteria bacterium]
MMNTRLLLKSGYRTLLFALYITSGIVLAEESPKDVYKTYCWQCHGMQADGMGLNIRDMSVQPRDHTDSKEMSARSNEEMFKAIKEGGSAIGKSALMPAWKNVLTDDEIHGLVRYLRELCNC